MQNYVPSKKCKALDKRIQFEKKLTKGNMEMLTNFFILLATSTLCSLIVYVLRLSHNILISNAFTQYHYLIMEASFVS